MAVIYAAVRKSTHTDYEIEVPDLPGCTAVAKVCGDIQKKAREAINEYIVQLKKSGKDFIFISAFRDLVDLKEYLDNVTWHCIYDIDTLGLNTNFDLY